MSKRLPGLISTFPYQNASIAGVAGNPFVDFTSYSSTWDFKAIDQELCVFFAKNPLPQIPMVTGYIPNELKHEYFNLTFEDEYFEQQLDDNEIKLLSTMDVYSRRKYLYFTNKILLPWAFILSLKPNMFTTKSQDLTPWEPFVDSNLSYTKKCIQELPFKQIGRVVVYGSWGGSPVPCHRDGYLETHKDHHINFNPGGYRPVYLYDPVKKEKQYLPDSYKLYAYNVRDYHGVDALFNFSYTVRVDGEFTDEVISNIGLIKGFVC